MPLSSFEGDHRISTPPTSPASLEWRGISREPTTGPTGRAPDFDAPEHDYHSLSTVITSRRGRRLTRNAPASTADIRRTANDADFDDYLLYSPPCGDHRVPTSVGDKNGPPPSRHAGSIGKADDISRWAEEVAPTSTADEPPDLTKNGFRRTSSRPSSRSAATGPAPSRSPAAARGIGSRDLDSSMKHSSLVHSATSSSFEARDERTVTLPPDSLSPSNSPLVSPPFSLPTSQAGLPTSAATSSSPAGPRYTRALSSSVTPNAPIRSQDARSPTPAPPRRETSEDHLASVRSGTVGSRGASPQLQASPSDYSVPLPVPSRGLGEEAISSPPSSTALLAKSASTKPRRPSHRRGPFPVPALSPEERAARRALRKAGLSHEHHLLVHETKSARRRQAWLERQAVSRR